MIQLSTASRAGMMNTAGLGGQFNTVGWIYVFAGPRPANANVALDMTTHHTEIAKLGLGGGPISFDLNAEGDLIIPTGDTWTAVAAFSGAQAAQPTLTPSFYRLCAQPDDGRAAADPYTGYRVQGTVGGALSAADLRLPQTSYAQTDPVTLARFTLRLLGR